MAVKCITSYNGTEENGAVKVNVINFLLQKGFTVDQMIGIMGNIDVESDGFKTAVVEYSGGGGHGLIQWTGSRWHKLEKYAKDHNKSWKDLDLQLDYLWYELNNDEKATKNWFASHPKASIRESVIQWQNGFERCGECHQDKRISAADRAKTFYEKYANGDCANVQFLSVDGSAENTGDSQGMTTEVSQPIKGCNINVSVSAPSSNSSDEVNVGGGSVANMTKETATDANIKVLGITTATGTRSGSPKYIFLHYTAGSSSTSGQWENTKETLIETNPPDKTTSYSSDYIVDDANIVQWCTDPSKRYCAAVGSYAQTKTPNNNRGRNARNSNGLSIEACSTVDQAKFKASGDVKLKPNKDYFYYTQGVLDNMARLCRYLMNKYNIPKENVLRHYDVSGKSCPGIIGWNPDSGSEATYEAFVNAL